MSGIGDKPAAGTKFWSGSLLPRSAANGHKVERFIQGVGFVEKVLRRKPRYLGASQPHLCLLALGPGSQRIAKRNEPREYTFHHGPESRTRP